MTPSIDALEGDVRAPLHFGVHFSSSRKSREPIAHYLILRYTHSVDIVSRKALRLFWEQHPESRTALLRWFQVVRQTRFRSFAELRKTFPSVDQVGNWIVFNIGGNKYRLIASIHFNRGKVYVRHVLSHQEYDRGSWKNDAIH